MTDDEIRIYKEMGLKSLRDSFEMTMNDDANELGLCECRAEEYVESKMDIYDDM